jgi:hypothetical protein
MTLIRQAGWRGSDMYRSTVIQKMRQTFNGADWEVKHSIADMHAAEAILMDAVKPVIEILQKLRDDKVTVKGPHCSPAEILASFQIGMAHAWFCWAKANMSSAAEDTKALQGHYPRDRVPTFIVLYIKDVIHNAEGVVHDERIAQPMYALEALIGDELTDVALIEKAVTSSLKLTNNKVTELTPYPIPEVLAVNLDLKGKDDEALKWYETALDGIRLCVSRAKVDAIVYRACALQAKTDVSKALRWAFTYSPKYSNSQDGIQPKAGRELLAKLVEEWVHKIGCKDVAAAQAKLMKAAE